LQEISYGCRARGGLTQVVVAMEYAEDGAASKQKVATHQSGVGSSSALPIVEEETKDQQKVYVEATAHGIQGAATFLDGNVPASFKPVVKSTAGMLLTALSAKPVQDACELVGRTGKTVLDSSYVQRAAESANPYLQAGIQKGTPVAQKAFALAQPLAIKAYDEAGSAYARWTQRSSTVGFAVSETTNCMWLAIAWVRSCCPGKPKTA